MHKTKHLVALVAALAMVMLFAVIVAAEAGPTININTASVEELTQLDRVGPKYAERIVAYRNANGPFGSVDDLKNVKGVGDKILDLNRDRITIGQP